MREEEIAALSLRQHLPDAAIKAIVEQRGTLKGMLALPMDELFHNFGIEPQKANAIIKTDTREAENKLQWLEKAGGQLVLMEDELYPAILKEIYDPPACLYVLGKADCLNDFCISLVGARKSSQIGEDMAKKLAGELAASGVTVVSGFAYGIDINAHLGAVKAGGSTVAVLGSGLNDIYPKSNSKHIEAICRDGCLITEFDPNEKPYSYNFPKRNRIVAGISRGVVVVEAAARSGSLITARLAHESGRDVFAVPTSPLFANNATNTMLKDTAHIACCATDILEHYTHLFNQPSTTTEPAAIHFDSPEERKLYEAIAREPLSTDELVPQIGLTYAELVSLLLMMEMKSLIKKGVDGRFSVD
ncbi:MAG: DNA-processing protein DprA [Deferribacteraceae bacterium]|jgi:DNA processing protein|nr:DNA-processing protein DprA [Deferribacteraceae bacterium]